MKIGLWTILGLSLLAFPAAAAVKQTTPAGFEIADSVDIAASPEQVYQALGQIGRWWSPMHTYSGDAANLGIELKAAGCFCEIAKSGLQVQHMIVVYVNPGKTVRLRGALGPLQGEGVDGTLTWSMAPAGQGVRLTQDYIVGGYLRDGPAKWAPTVDEVLHEQLVRLEAFVETGTPDRK